MFIVFPHKFVIKKPPHHLSHKRVQVTNILKNQPIKVDNQGQLSTIKAQFSSKNPVKAEAYPLFKTGTLSLSLGFLLVKQHTYSKKIKKTS